MSLHYSGVSASILQRRKNGRSRRISTLSPPPTEQAHSLFLTSPFCSTVAITTRTTGRPAHIDQYVISISAYHRLLISLDAFLFGPENKTSPIQDQRSELKAQRSKARERPPVAFPISTALTGCLEPGMLADITPDLSQCLGLFRRRREECMQP